MTTANEVNPQSIRQALIEQVARRGRVATIAQVSGYAANSLASITEELLDLEARFFAECAAEQAKAIEA